MKHALAVCLGIALIAGCGGDVDHVAQLRDRLTSASAAERRAALEELRLIGPLSDDDLQRVATALRDDDRPVRAAAAQTLVAQASERPELQERLVAWASATEDAHCRQLLQQAAVGKFPTPED